MKRRSWTAFAVNTLFKSTSQTSRLVLFLGCVLVIATGCGGRAASISFQGGGGNSSNGGSPSGGAPSNGGSGTVVPVPVPAPTTDKSPQQLETCGSLDFSGAQFPASFSHDDEQAFMVALNISGSYEGASGWANLANNSDGQGLSMGLLNQNLGQGTLQPLLIQMSGDDMADLQAIFGSSHLQSLLGMLTSWEAATPSSSALSLTMSVSLFSQKPLDQNRGNPDTLSAMSSTASAADSQSVQWAAATLYTSSGGFDSTWQTELTNLGQNPYYVSLQIAAATGLHEQAIADEQNSGVIELRSYLMMFDVDVQDGGFYTQDWTDYQTYLSQNPNATDTDRLTELVTLRLRHVQSQYVSDVQSRKMTIVDGTGTVHGSARNLPQQYCYSSTYSYRVE